MSNLIPVACSLRTAVPGAIVRPHKYGNCCEKEGQLLSVGVVYYLRVISDFPWQLFTPRVLCFSLPPFLPAPEKLLLFVMIFCPPASSAHSLPPPPTHKPRPLNLLFFDQSRKESGACFYFITSDTPGHKRKPLSLLLFYSTLSPLHSRQTEPGHALHVALHIMMSLKSLFSSLPLNTLPLLLCSPSLALSFSVSLLLSPCSTSQPELENKRDQTQVRSSSL